MKFLFILPIFSIPLETFVWETWTFKGNSQHFGQFPTPNSSTIPAYWAQSSSPIGRKSSAPLGSTQPAPLGNSIYGPHWAIPSTSNKSKSHWTTTWLPFTIIPCWKYISIIRQGSNTVNMVFFISTNYNRGCVTGEGSLNGEIWMLWIGL